MIFSAQFHSRKFLPILFLIVLGVTIYSNSLQGDFCSDDYNFVLNNTAIENIGDFKGIWRAFTTRFVLGLSFAFNYWISGYHTLSYHVFNVFVHILAAILVYFFVNLTLQTPALKDFFTSSQTRLIPFFASLIFISHPIQTQGVAYITQRAVALASVFYLSTFICYIKGRLGGRGGWFFAAFLMMLVGAFTKEMMITLPFLLTIYEFYFFQKEESWQKRILRLAPFFLIVPLIGFALLIERSGSIFELKGQLEGGGFDWNYFFTEVNVLRTYLRLLVFPFNQQHDYHYPIVSGFWQWPTVLSALLIISLALFAVWQFKKSRLLSFAVVWFFGTMSLEVIHPCFIKKGIIYEHWLYLAMVGFTIFASVCILKLERQKAQVVFLLLIALFSVLTYQRNKVWRNPITLWTDNLKKSPKNPTAYFALGVAYGQQGDHAKEILYYGKTLQLDPTYYQAFNNTAVAYLRLGNIDNAVRFCQRALAIRPNHPEALATLGACYLLQGNRGDAKHLLHRAIEEYDRHGQIYKSRHAQNILRWIP